MIKGSSTRWLTPVIPMLSRLTPRQTRGIQTLQDRHGGEEAWAFEGTDRLLSQLEAEKELII